MSSWRVHPGRVREILGRIEAQEQSMAGIAQRLTAQDASGTTPGASAVASFYDAHVLAVRWIENRLGEIRDGTTKAVDAYDAGDLDMAAEQQSAATRARHTNRF
jgi:hypothetical protein